MFPRLGQGHETGLLCWSSVDRAQGAGNRLALLPGYLRQRVPDLVNEAALDQMFLIISWLLQFSTNHSQEHFEFLFGIKRMGDVGRHNYHLAFAYNMRFTTDSYLGLSI